VRRVDGGIAKLAARQHGVVCRRQLLELGLVESKIESRRRRGALVPVHRGVYAVGHDGLTVEGRWMAAVLACGPGSALSHRSAAQLWGLIRRSGSIPEVTRPATFRPRPGVCAHRSLLPDDEIDVAAGIPVTSVSRTLLDLAPILDRDPTGLERALSEAEVRSLTSRRSLPDLLERYRGRPGTVAIRRLLADDEARRGVTRNDFEEAFVALVDATGLPRPRLNADVALRGRFIELDCLWSAQRLFVELDGRAVHGTQRAFEADRERDRVLLAEGWRGIRVTWRQLRHEPDAVASDLRRMLVARAVT